MKKIIFTSALIILTVFTFAQSPQAFKYQTVVRDVAGEILQNQVVGLKMSIHETTANGTIVYQETFTKTTNNFGLVNLEIGTGTSTIGTFATIDWGSGSKFLETELDPAGGSTYVSMGTSQLLSVPYALHAGTSDDGDWIVSGDDMYSNVSGNIGVGNSNPEIPLDVFGNNETMINGMIAIFDSDETDYSRVAIDGDAGADAQLSFMNNGSSKWTLGNDVSSNNSFVIRKGFGAFGTNDVFVITPDGQADLNVPLLGNQGGLTVGKKAAEANGQTFSIVRSVGAHSVDTRYVTGLWAQSFGAYNAGTKLGNIGLSGSNKDVVDFMSFGVGGYDWWDTYSLFSVDKFGNVGIGRFAAHKSPTAKLEIDGSGTYDLLKINTAASLTAFIVESSGEVGIGTDSPTYKLVVNGEAAKPGGGSWLTWSDKRLKDIQGDYKKGLDEIIQLHPVVYSYKKDTPQNLPSDKDYTGLIAQEVQEIFPEAVSDGKDGFLTLNMQAVNMAVFNAIIELKERNDLLQEQNKMILVKNKELEKRIELLEREK